jgi:hypothetical protein
MEEKRMGMSNDEGRLWDEDRNVASSEYKKEPEIRIE